MAPASTHPTPIENPQRGQQHGRDWRTGSIIIGLVVLWALLIARLVYLQTFQREAFGSRAQRQQISQESVPARPGDILDRRGRLLATSIQAPSLYVDPSRIDDPEDFARKLAAPLGLDAGQLAEQLRQHADKRFLWVKRRLFGREATRVRELQLPNSVAGYRLEFQRRYPQGALAAHVLGLRTIDNVGRGGIEEFCNELLMGEDGIRRFVRDARGYVLDIMEEVTVPPTDGAAVTLTIDTVVQLAAETELDRLVSEHQPRGACAIVMDPHTGELLAMASRPAFDPRQPVDVPPAAWKNQAISAVYEPGSTFKPLVVAWALDRGLVQRDEVLNCEYGTYRMGRRLLHDHHAYGDLTLTDVLVKSSNIGMAKIGERLGNPGLWDVCRACGFGRSTGIELGGELEGILHPLPNWTSYSTGSIPMGQELAVTPIQLITAHAALANGGRRVPPHVIAHLGSDGAATPAIIGLPILREQTARWIVEGPLRQVVERGTGQKAHLEGYTVFGKTGTAQKVSLNGGGYSQSRHVSSFVCGAPANDPAAVVLVMVDEPAVEESQFGGTVAAPYAAAILEKTLRYLQVPPDQL